MIVEYISSISGYELLISFITLTLLEIILGIDNLVFIALVATKLPAASRKLVLAFGLMLALVIRALMLFTLSWIMGLNQPIFSFGEVELSYKSLMLIAGGIFLMVKSGREIYSDIKDLNLHRPIRSDKKSKINHSFLFSVLQITAVDFIFSFDSIITAVAMTNNIPIIIAAVIISMIIMLMSSGYIADFLNKYPSLKIIALAFIFLVGAILFADGFEIEIQKGYLYFALFFTIAVESLNIVARKKKHSK